MNTDKQTYHLFTPSGCLKPEAMKQYLSSSLSQKDKDRVQHHLDSCELCQDALEGLELLSDKDKLDAIVSEINQNLRQNLQMRQSSKKIKITNRVFYYSAAASIIILVGLLFNFNGILKQDLKQLDTSDEIELIEKDIPQKPIAKNSEPIKEKKETYEKKAEIIKPKPEKKRVEKTKSAKQSEAKSGSAKNDQLSLKESHEIIKTSEQKVATSEVAETASLDELDSDETFPNIASIQPIEYYLAEVIVLDHQPKEDLSTENGIQTNYAPKMSLRAISSEKSKGKATNEKTLDGLAFQNEDMDESAPINEIQKKDNQTPDHFFQMVDKMAEFPGGFDALKNYLSEHLEYPKPAKEQNTSGRVVLTFIVNEDGTVSDITVQQGIGEACDREAIRVIESMPEWKAAVQDGHPVKVRFTLPIYFKLQ